MNLETREKSSLFSAKTIEISGAAKPGKSPASFLKSFLKAHEELFPFYLIHFDKFEACKLKNMRGRAPENFNNTDPHIPRRVSQEKQQLEELFFAEGFILKDEEDENSEDAPEKFELAIYSEFESFKGSSHIEYKTQAKVSKNLIELLDLPNLSCFLEENPKLEITFARLGLEFFKASFIASLIGSMPSISERFYLELSGSDIRLFASYTEKSKHQSITRLVSYMKNLDN